MKTLHKTEAAKSHIMSFEHTLGGFLSKANGKMAKRGGVEVEKGGGGGERKRPGCRIQPWLPLN